jgi:hypothetical protein
MQLPASMDPASWRRCSPYALRFDLVAGDSRMKKHPGLHCSDGPEAGWLG